PLPRPPPRWAGRGGCAAGSERGGPHVDDRTELPPRTLEQISTHWPMIQDPARFVLRYAPAIESYLHALVRDPHAVEEIAQDFLLRVVERGLIPEANLRGRFRNYLKAAVRNAA